MATSGNKSVKVTNYDTLKFSWSAGTPSIANNSTPVSWRLELVATNYGRISSSVLKAWSVTVNGTKYSGSVTVGIANNATKTLASGSTTIKHNADGSKTFSYSFSQDFSGIVFNGSTLGKVSGSGSGTLNSIPRQATITSAPNFSDEDNPVLNYSNPAGSAVTSLQACIGWTGNDDIAYRDISKTGTSYTFNLTTAERDKIRKACANAKSMSVKFYLKTVIGGETYYSRLAKTVSIVNANPTMSPSAVEDADSSTDGGDAAGNIAATGSNIRWLKGVSDVRYAFNATALKGATIKSYKVECGTQKATSASGVLFNVESGTIKFTVTDSRGNTTTQTLTRTLVNYIKPTCDLVPKIALESGTTAKATVKVSGKWFNGQIKSGVANVLSLWIRYKEEDGNYSSWVKVTPTLSGNTYNINYTIPEALNYQNNYTFQARVQDNLYLAYNGYINSDTITVNALPVFDWGKSDFNFNVPVNMKKNINYENGGNGIRGTTTTGIGVSAFTPCNADNNCVIGYGAYADGIGGTNVYGNNINIVSKNSVFVNGMEIAENKVLWSGGAYMTDTQHITLSEAVNKQANGIVLIFSRYNSGESLNESFSCHFVPKQMVALHNGYGLNFNLCGMFANGVKYLYIHNDKIVGHANNNIERTVGGITYNNAYYVLRYVIGV